MDCPTCGTTAAPRASRSIRLVAGVGAAIGAALGVAFLGVVIIGLTMTGGRATTGSAASTSAEPIGSGAARCVVQAPSTGVFVAVRPKGQADWPNADAFCAELTSSGMARLPINATYPPVSVCGGGTPHYDFDLYARTDAGSYQAGTAMCVRLLGRDALIHWGPPLNAPRVACTQGEAETGKNPACPPMP